MELRRGTAQNYTLYETAKIRSRILPAGGLGVPPRFNKSHKIGGLGGLIETITTVSIQRAVKDGHLIASAKQL